MAKKLNEIKSILIFEPWNLGDLIISVYFAKKLNRLFNIKFDFICDPSWFDWLKEQTFVNNVFKFHAPWTEKRGKYSLKKYDLNKAILLKKEIEKSKYDFTWDARGDVRHKIFLNILCKSKIVSLKNNNNNNVYDRLNSLLIYFNFKDEFKHENIFNIKK